MQASTPFSQIDESEMDFAYPPEIEILSETEEQPRKPTAEAEAPACSLPVTNQQTHMPCKEGSFSKVDWNATADDEDEGMHPYAYPSRGKFLTLHRLFSSIPGPLLSPQFVARSPSQLSIVHFRGRRGKRCSIKA